MKLTFQMMSALLSLIIKKVNDTVEVFSLLSYTNVNVLPFTEDIPLEVITFLDPTIEKLCFEQAGRKNIYSSEI